MASISDRVRRVAFATYRDAPQIEAGDMKIAQCGSTVDASTAGDLDVRFEGVVWDDPDVSWQQYDMIVIRSTWDYHEKYPQFLQWLDRLDHWGCTVYNPTSVMRWNADKLYLQELEQRGVTIPPTVFLPRCSAAVDTAGAKPFAEPAFDLVALMKQRQWSKVVVKPSVSAGSKDTFVVTAADILSASALDELHRRISALRQHSAVLVQPFLQSVVDQGEWSLLFFDGAFSHACLKTPKQGDFRVQSMFGAATRGLDPPPHLLAFAHKVLQAIPGPPCLYVRVDVVEEPVQEAKQESASAVQRVADSATPTETPSATATPTVLHSVQTASPPVAHGAVLLMELELIEPYFYFAYDLHNKGPAMMYRAIVDKLRAAAPRKTLAASSTATTTTS